MTEFDWIVTERPASPAPDAVATRRARRALLDHIADAGAAPAPRPVRRRRSRALVLGGAAAAAAAAAVVVALAGGGSPVRPTGVDEAAASPLAKLSEQALGLPKPIGDATLVHRVQAYPDGTSMGGYDLYQDDGTYYYGATRAELRSAVRGGDQVYAELRALVAAATAAPTLSPDEARRRFLLATGAKTTSASNGPEAAAARADAERQAAEKEAYAEKMGMTLDHTPFSQQQLDDNMIWTTSLDVLVAGAARPEVRAGVMSLLATVPSVQVTKTVTDGRETLTLRDTNFSGGYVETLVVDAADGTPVSMTGGDPAKEPSVVVTYGVKRTTLAAIRSR